MNSLSTFHRVGSIPYVSCAGHEHKGPRSQIAALCLVVLISCNSAQLAHGAVLDAQRLTAGALRVICSWLHSPRPITGGMLIQRTCDAHKHPLSTTAHVHYGRQLQLQCPDWAHVRQIPAQSPHLSNKNLTIPSKSSRQEVQIKSALVLDKFLTSGRHVLLTQLWRRGHRGEHYQLQWAERAGSSPNFYGGHSSRNWAEPKIMQLFRAAGEL